jgi:two-component system, NtrC family, sensor kinase
MRFKRSLVVSLLIVFATLMMGCMAYYSYNVIYNLALESLKKNAFLDTQTGAKEIDHWLGTLKSHVDTLANTDIVRSLDWPLIEPYLKTEIPRFPGMQTIAIGNSDGWRYAVGAAPTNVKDRQYFQKAMVGLTNVSDPLIGRATKTPSIVIAAPIRPTSGATTPPIGEIHSIVNLNHVAQVIEKIQYGSNSYAFALNSAGKAIVHPNQVWLSTVEKPATSLTKVPDAALAALAQRMVNKEQGMELLQIDGTAKYVAYLPLKEAEWSIALVIPRANVESPLRALNLLAAVTAGLSLMLMAFWWQVKSSEQRRLQQSNQELEDRVAARTVALSLALEELKKSQLHLIHSEKMSSLGQLVAGIAHEINNPVNFIYGNLDHAHAYTQDLIRLLQLYQKYDVNGYPAIQKVETAIDLEFLLADLPKIFTSMRMGAERIKAIVLSLRLFSRMDEAEVKTVNIHEGIDSTLVILDHRLKATAERAAIQVVKDYGPLPLVECYAGQLNQVFMNILSNAIDALEEINTYRTDDLRQITIRTGLIDAHWVKIEIIDNGVGMSEAVKRKIFDPFFTTKPIGKGTGMGLGISYQIIAEKHGGKLDCFSTLGQGSKFVMQIPLALSRQT